MAVQLQCVIEKKASGKEKKLLFPIAVLIPISQGTEVMLVTEYVFWFSA